VSVLSNRVVANHNPIAFLFIFCINFTSIFTSISVKIDYCETLRFSVVVGFEIIEKGTTFF